MPGMRERVSVVEVQKEVGVPGPELIRAIVYGELSCEENEHGQYLVDPDEVAEFAQRYFASQEPPIQ